MDLAPYTAGAPLRLGTSSFSSKDWVGPFYPMGMKPGAFLGFYANHFDAVEVDSTYYGIPKPSMVDGWNAKTPDGFLMCAKFPRSIVHGGAKAAPDARYVMDPDATYEDRDRFLEAMRRMGAKLGPLLLQFPYFNRAAFPSPGPFLERLERFLTDLPREDLRFSVEVRNKAWVRQELVDLLRAQDVGMTLVDHAWMPHGDDVDERFDAVTGDDLYVRLLGDRKAIETITKRWTEEVIDQGPRLVRWADLIVKHMKRGIRTLVFVNNHYAGHAPTTVRRLRTMIEERLEGEGVEGDA